MRNALSLIVCGCTIFMITSFSWAGDWERCVVCHKDTGKPAPSKEQLLLRFNTVEEFVEAGKSSNNRMMNFVKTNDELLESVAREIGIGVKPEPPVEEAQTQGFDMKEMVREKCTSCHDMNRIADAPEHSTSKWFHILSKMEVHKEGLLTPEEMMMLVDWLYAHHHELKTTP